MIKYCHELSEDEYLEILKNGITYGEFAEKYPQPPWCTYPDATEPLGCWSLMDFETRRVNEDYCKNCECYKGNLRGC